jgi:pathogenesis-related protein 1
MRPLNDSKWPNLAFGLVLLLNSLAWIPLASAVDLDEDQMVAQHNRWRRLAGVPLITYSDELADSAQEWADRLQEDLHCKMKHSQSNGRYGENIYWASPALWSDGQREIQEITAKTVVDKWGQEQRDYDYKRNRCSKGKLCGHYTQVVWKTTTEVGCGFAVCDDTLEQVWVCHYSPAGNWTGQRPY